jgi:beta-galactosidase
MRTTARILIAFCLFAVSFMPRFSAAQDSGSSPITIDAAKPLEPPAPADFQGGTPVNPHAQSIGMNARYLTLDGKPWLPVMGEFHYTRVPESQWEDEILKMKAAGIQIIATYVIWIHQEEVEGQFDWEGRRDLRHFVELCAKHGMYVYPRIGPWAHGEARNGGFPDWLLQKTKNTRQNDPVYLSYVKTWYDQIGRQLQGLLWKDGGPVIGIQLENEYSARGPDKGDAYILQLKKMAIDAGLDVPIYSVTGWDNAVVPRGAVVAVFGGYPDAPWDSSLEQLPPQEVYTFRFGSRVSGNMGMIGAVGHPQEIHDYEFPFITAEMGGGVEDTYHRRPVILPDDVAAMMPVMLGSGVNLYGTYMFQGGENPAGRLTTLQESQATNYPTDVPVKSYDFQAPLSEFGEEREVLRKLKVFDYFLNDFGDQLAPMMPFAPAELPANPQDLSVPRISVRTDGKSGFLFFNNYVRYDAMPARPHFQLRIKLPDRELLFPETPVNLPLGVYGIWPFGLTLGNLHLRYATAELFTRTQSSTGDTYYFVETAGVHPQFVFDNAGSLHVQTSGRSETHNGALFVSDLQPSLEPAIAASDTAAHTTRIVLLSQQQAETAWKLTGSEHLLLTADQFFADGNNVTLDRDGNSEFAFSVVPPAAPPTSQTPARTKIESVQNNSFASSFHAKLPAIATPITVKPTQQPGAVPPIRLGPAVSWRPQGVAIAPDDQEFSLAAKWRISIPEADWAGVHNLFLQIHYDGDVARLISGGDLLDDNFYNGEPWSVGLDRFRSQIEKSGLELDILPRRADAPIFLERRYRDPEKEGQIDRLGAVTLVPQYRLQLVFGQPEKPQ